ncbi:phage holin family protein [Streptomyces sp. SID11385]|uniref:phage holin family protein n=1 Tax=Streptomyces sp. SID11385 TaxID=2706031 RepID=UPI0013C6DA3A|nr:phage holin family protein [Streptomyces sp. SID11385]NEA44626.1 phage holin family protein [Streptomyces sp. SID11385]
MKTFVFRTLANAAALAVAVWLLDGITLTGHNTGHRALTLIIVALVFGVVNVLVKPLVQLVTLPLLILTLGLLTLVVNALMLLLTSWICDLIDVPFHVSGFWTAVLGGLVVAVVSWAVSLALPDGRPAERA